MVTHGSKWLITNSLIYTTVAVFQPKLLSSCTEFGTTRYCSLTSLLPVVVYYLGYGKRDTGDWCFQDGFITFSDIAELYSRYLRGRVLTIIADCSHSGAWVNACLDYLDERGVRPCGHSAKEKGILIKVYASCRPDETAATNCFFVQAAENDTNIDNSGTLCYYTTKKLSKSQHCYGASTTDIMCKKSAEEACALRPEFTWRKWREGHSGRIFIQRGTDSGGAVWHYVLLDDDPQKIREYKRLMQDECGQHSVNPADHGKVLKSGQGRDPPQEVKDEILRPYQFML